MKPNTIIILLFFTLFISGNVAAIPAYPYFIQMTQPNGETITVKMKGDERMKWMESEDGYSLVYGTNKSIVFARQNEQGDMVPSEIIARNIELRSEETKSGLKNIPKHLSYSQKQTETLQQLWNITQEASLRSSKATQATTGTIHVLCALIGFPDMPFAHTQEEFDRLMNQTGYVNGTQKGSVRDFYKENSYGQLDMVITVVGPYTAVNNHDYYGENQGNAKDAHAVDLAKEAANFAFKDPDINPADFDNDGDGYIDVFHFLFAGYGEESGASANSIWSHKYGFWSDLKFWNKKLNTYSCSPELRGNTGNHITYIGPICHESCHVFGAPDYYDTDGAESGGEFLGTGKWDLMADGCWNNQGAIPAHINMFQKIDFGWVTPIELSSPETITDMPNSAENPVAYVIRSTNTNEYYLLENRQKTGFDAAIPGTGLLIYHVNYKQSDFLYNTVNNRHPQGIYPVCSGSSVEIPTETPASYGSINSSSCTYPITGMGNANFTDQSTPAAFLWTGQKLGKPVTDIIQKNKLISFNFMPREFFLNLKAEIDGNRATLTWEKPASEKEIIGYKIYRNNQFIQQTTNTIYRATLTAEGTYTYGVSVLYEGDEESPKEEVEVVYKKTGMDSITQHPAVADPNAEFSIYTISGQFISKGQINTYNQLTMNLPAGVYIVRIKQNQQISNLKIEIWGNGKI